MSSPRLLVLHYAGMSTITKRALDLRRATRTGRGTHISRGGLRLRTHPRPLTPSDNYGARVLGGEFEPTALRARQLAASRGQSLHALAHELGYAGPPPAVRARVDLTTLSRSQVAKVSGYSTSDISRLFARKHPPTLTKLSKIASAYGVWMDDMLTALGW